MEWEWQTEMAKTRRRERKRNQMVYRKPKIFNMVIAHLTQTLSCEQLIEESSVKSTIGQINILPFHGNAQREIPVLFIIHFLSTCIYFKKKPFRLCLRCHRHHFQPEFFQTINDNESNMCEMHIF